MSLTSCVSHMGPSSLWLTLLVFTNCNACNREQSTTESGPGVGALVTIRFVVDEKKFTASIGI